MKRFLLGCMGVAGVMLLGMSICQRIALVNCEYDLVDVDPSVDWSDVLDPEIVLEAFIEIDNVNEIDVIIDKIDMDFLVNDSVVFNGSPTPGDTIPEGTTDTISIPMEVEYEVLGKALLDLILGDTVTYELKGTIFLETEVVSDSFPITIKKGKI